MIATPTPDATTKLWMRDASDELAVRNGCWFDEKRGQFVVDWMYDYLRLYEGDCAGEPFECKDWQYEATMRMFGWVRTSPAEDWDRVIRRFRKAIIFIAKKNKKSPTLAAWACYLAFGDGEMGQKVFPTAKDGAQIRENVVRHVHEMIRQSDQLAAECKINKSTGNVFHEETRSLLMPLSSDNIASQKSKEGLNGSVVVDEVHVVDKAHMRRISRAGISRAEPLQIEVSTAGNEPESYGFGRFNYAQGVVSGSIQDDQTLAIIYAAPQDVTDAEIHADPMKYGRMANPAMGHTVKPSEYMADYTQSKKSISEFADFKMYRLNIWQQSASPWLSVHDWAQCPGTEGELLLGDATFGGLDLSRKIDLTAWVMFQPGDTPKCYGHYWCPRQRAEELSAQFEIPLLEWAEQGWVTLVNRRGIDYDAVCRKLHEDIEKYQISHVGFDPYNSDQVVKYCEDNLQCEMVEVRQGIPSLSAPTKELELLVAERQLDHRCDPVLAWMIGNTSIRTDENGNIKPLKSVGGVWKHIDGVISLVMAKYMAMLNPDTVSIYAQPGALTE